MIKKWIVAMIVLVFAFQGVVAAADMTIASPSKKALKLIKKAEKAIKAKDFPKAAEEYNKVIEMEPACAEGYFGLGRLHLVQNQLEEGEKNLVKTLELNPGHTEAAKLLSRLYFSQAQQLQQQRKTAEANLLFVKLTEIPGIETADRVSLGQSLYQLGVNYYTQKKFTESTAFLTRFQKLPMAQTEFAPMFPAANYIIGLNCSQMKDYKASEEYLKKYIDARQDVPNDQLLPLAHFIIGSNHFQIMETLAKEIKKDKESKDRRKKLADLAAKYADKIVPQLEKAIELKSDLEPAYMTLGNFFYYANEMDKTVATYEKMVSLFPSSPDLGQYKKFLEDLNKEIAARKAAGK